MILQRENKLSKTQLQHKQSKELLDNHMGDFGTLKPFDDEHMVSRYIDGINEFGFKWAFLSLDWMDFNEALQTGEYSTHYVGYYQDKVITDLVDNGVKIIYCLVYHEPVDIDVPFSWTNQAYIIKNANKEGRFRTEGEIQRYLDYARFIVRHFKDRIKYYQILNEPLNGIIGQYVKSEDYINLVRRVVPVIRDECPDAKIIVGSVHGLPNQPGCLPDAPGSYDYLFDILSSDIMPLVGGISFHPGHDRSPEFDPACSSGAPCEDISEGYYEYYQQTLQEIKDVATSHGFNGEYITEGPVFAGQPPLPPQTHYYTDIVAAKYYGRSIIMHLNKNVSVILPLGISRLTPLTIRVVQNLCNIMAGAEPVSLPVEIESEATNTRGYGFSLPNGDRLLALWTDGVAVDDDPGVNTTVIVPGFSAQKVTAIDVLNGFQQQLVTSVEDGTLVIHNLLVKDYPIILHLID